jgi:gag-polyprotein putative aspartyl protease
MQRACRPSWPSSVGTSPDTTVSFKPLRDHGRVNLDKFPNRFATSPMQNTSIIGYAAAALGLTLSLSAPVPAADAEPTMKQIYEAATTGHLDKAQQMITKVLANHPESAKAHYVQAEVYVKEGKKSFARSELLEAERLNPGLTKFSEQSVRELKAQLGVLDSTSSRTSVKPLVKDQLIAPIGENRIPLTTMGGTLIAPVVINNSIKLNFLVDSGASDVSIPADVFSTLVRTNTVTQTDITGFRNYRNADGEISQSKTFVIRSLKLGNIEVLNVHAKEAPADAPLLLGQSFLKRFKSWSIDNSTQELILER